MAGELELTMDDHIGESFLKIFADDNVTPAMVDGSPVWESSDPTVLMPKGVRPDGMSVESIEPVAPGGPVRIAIMADADRGAGVKTITAVSRDIMVLPGVKPAAMMTLELGPITPKV